MSTTKGNDDMPSEATMVYTTETGEKPRGGASLTKDATEPLPPPTKRIRKATTKKAKPRVRAKAEPLHTHIQLDKRVLATAKKIIADKANLYSTYEMVDHETAIVR